MDAASLSRRQINDNTVYYDGYWWYSETAYIVKWVVITVLLFLLFLYFVGGYYHARRRMKKGLPPMRYHRWLVPRRARAEFAARNPQFANDPYFRPYYAAGPIYYTQTSVNGRAYHMGHYGPPPPAYGTPEYLPTYTAAQGPNKTNPNQSYAAPPAEGVSVPPPVHNAGPSR